MTTETNDKAAAAAAAAGTGRARRAGDLHSKKGHKPARHRRFPMGY